jgi:hypothetical protein
MTRLETAREIDAHLKGLVRAMRATEAEVARALMEMKRRGLFRFLGYSRIQDYAAVELDVSRAKAKDLIEIARKARALPAIEQAFENGDLDWTKARQIVRVATPETEEHWLREAQTLSNRGLENAIARAKGERPKVRIVLEVSEEEAADIDDAVRRLREERGEAVAIGPAIAELSRRAMGSPIDRPGYQVVIHECPRCEKASRDAREGAIEVSNEELAAAKVDAEIIDLREGGKGTFKHTITPAERRAVIARDRGRCAICGTQAWLHIHHLERRDGDVRVLVLLCSACHKGLVHAGHVTIDGGAPVLRTRLWDGSPVRTRSG